MYVDGRRDRALLDFALEALELAVDGRGEHEGIEAGAQRRQAATVLASAVGYARSRSSGVWGASYCRRKRAPTRPCDGA
jgi:hypothetical protein